MMGPVPRCNPGPTSSTPGTIDDIIAEGDKLAMGFTRPIQRDAVRGISPIGEDVLMTETTVYRIAHGTIAENWSSFDLLGLLQKEGNQMSQEKKGGHSQPTFGGTTS
jgi:SnoaL-like polyketide cyclase